MKRETKLNIYSAVILVIAFAGMIGIVYLIKHMNCDVDDIFWAMEATLMFVAGFYLIKLWLIDKIK